MAPLPKKKRTQARKGKRWSHSRLHAAALTTCPQCRIAKPTHRVCANCGYYAGREVLTVVAGERGQES